MARTLPEACPVIRDQDTQMYLSKGMRIATSSTTLESFLQDIPPEERGHPLSRTLHLYPDRFITIAQPPELHGYEDLRIPKAYLAGVIEDGIITHDIVHTCPAARGHGIGTHLLVHTILNAANDLSIDEYHIVTARRGLRTVLTTHLSLPSNMTLQSTHPATYRLEFTPDRRETIVHAANAWLAPYRIPPP